MFKDMITICVYYETNGTKVGEDTTEAEELFLNSSFDKQIGIFKRAILSVDKMVEGRWE
jgi:hypothetical protein